VEGIWAIFGVFSTQIPGLAGGWCLAWIGMSRLFKLLSWWLWTFPTDFQTFRRYFQRYEILSHFWPNYTRDRAFGQFLGCFGLTSRDLRGVGPCHQWGWGDCLNCFPIVRGHFPMIFQRLGDNSKFTGFWPIFSLFTPGEGIWPVFCVVFGS